MVAEYIVEYFTLCIKRFEYPQVSGPLSLLASQFIGYNGAHINVKYIQRSSFYMVVLLNV